jgi:DNA-binding response OmpR family regulator
MPNIPCCWQVLIVEADRVFSASLALDFAIHGHYTQFAQSGCEAIQTLSRFEPTVAVVGAELPDLPGIELARTIELRFPSCRIFFLSDRPSPDFLSEVAALGNNSSDVLIKSVHPGIVYQEISSLFPAEMM